MANKVSPYKGKLVYIRQTWGHNAGQVDEQYLYQVRQCGDKMATLVRLDKTTLQPVSYRGKGQNYYLHTREEVDTWNRQQEAQANRGYRQFKFWDWSQFFVPQGEAGWDPDMNF